MKKQSPTLFLIPSTLGDVSPNEVIPTKTLQVIKQLEHFVVEEEKTARRFLIRAGIQKPIEAITFYILNEHTDKKGIAAFLKNAGNADIGLLSEAGAPAVADPGADLVHVAHRMGFNVVPLVGPSSILLAIMASGLNGQNFAFTGYLPVKINERISRLKYLEKKSLQENQAQLFIEAPYRNNQLMKAIVENCSAETWLCVAANLTLENEWIDSKTVGEWKKEMPELHKQPAIFILQRGR
jgi:16S rRNA (cytidine1402-2'-O)-methyltransferase